MNFILPLIIEKLYPSIHYTDKIYLTGSCFTEHMTRYLRRAKFQVMENAHGILFNPISVCNSIQDVIDKKTYTNDDLFLLDEYWHSWYHHSDFSDIAPTTVLQKINDTIHRHHHFLKEAKYLILTLGSAFAYYHKEKKIHVSNNHRAPHDWFEKELLDSDFILRKLEMLQSRLEIFNPECKIIFTISPVRHIRDGVIDNNRSKAKLIDAVHKLKNCYYFPAYEIVIDQLRDYRYYDADMVHPNYQATEYVWEQFIKSCIDPSIYDVMKEIEDIYKAFRHKPRNTQTDAHRKFLKSYSAKVNDMSNRFSYLDFDDEKQYFNANPY